MLPWICLSADTLTLCSLPTREHAATSQWSPTLCALVARFLGSEDGYWWVSHGGDSIGHHSLVTLFPDLNMTVFTSATGPNEGALASARTLIEMFALDVFNG